MTAFALYCRLSQINLLREKAGLSPLSRRCISPSNSRERWSPFNLPKGLLNVVTGRGNIVGAELVRNPDVAKISFAGSVAVGETIMRDGAQTMKRVTLELGGITFRKFLERATPRTDALPSRSSTQMTVFDVRIDCSSTPAGPWETEGRESLAKRNTKSLKSAVSRWRTGPKSC
jgi:hypothetical protein